MTAKTRQAAAAKTLPIDGGAPARRHRCRRAIGEAERKRVDNASAPALSAVDILTIGGTGDSNR